MRKGYTFLFPFLIASGVVLVDRISKFLVVNSGWTYVTNPGVAFGFFSSLGIVLPILVLLVLFLWIFRIVRVRGVRSVDVVVFGLIIAGGVSNEMDRLIEGGVVDIFYFGIGPQFNLADIAIVSGLLVAIWDVIYQDNRRRKDADY